MSDDKDNRGYTTSTAKHSKATSNADSTALNLLRINNIINSTAKNTNFRYKKRVSDSKFDPVRELERRVLDKLRPMYSWENFKELMIAINSLTNFEKMEYLRKLENNLKNMNK